MDFFGTDGIRDRAGQGRLSPENVVRVGRALGRLAVEFARDRHPARVAIGRDPRPSGEGLVRRLTQALNTEGVDVVDLGVVPTPAVAWTVADGDYHLGIAVSASHNPPEDNGIKPFAPGGRKLLRAEEERLEAWMGEVEGPLEEHADTRTVDGAARYAASTASWLAKDGRLDGVRLVIDLSAGAASTTAPAVLRASSAREPAYAPLCPFVSVADTTRLKGTPDVCAPTGSTVNPTMSSSATSPDAWLPAKPAASAVTCTV